MISAHFNYPTVIKVCIDLKHNGGEVLKDDISGYCMHLLLLTLTRESMCVRDNRGAFTKPVAVEKQYVLYILNVCL